LSRLKFKDINTPLIIASAFLYFIHIGKLAKDPYNFDIYLAINEYYLDWIIFDNC